MFRTYGFKCRPWAAVLIMFLPTVLAFLLAAIALAVIPNLPAHH